MPVRSVPPDLTAVPVAAGAAGLVEAAGGVAPTETVGAGALAARAAAVSVVAPAPAVAAGGGALATVGFGVAGARAGAHAASSAVPLMLSTRSIAMRRLMRLAAVGVVGGRLAIVMHYRAL